ncbi:peroxidase family protein [Rhodopirellula baltica]
MWDHYTSWPSLTDRSFSGRHLPEASAEYQEYLTTVPATTVTELFRRTPDSYRHSEKSTVLFTHFAQWFTDGFLRTDRTDDRKNTSNHEIDLCQIYGLNSSKEKQLRRENDCKLKTSVIDGEHFPPLYFDEAGVGKPEFSEVIPFLPPEVSLPPERKEHVFVGGVERLNVSFGYVIMNTLFIREHNRLCDELMRAYPSWDNERIYQTARNTLIVILLRIVIEEYINHITPYHFQFRAEPWSFAREKWYRQNWMTVEFNLLYRWHSMVPNCVLVNGQFESVVDTVFNNRPLVNHGLGRMFDSASRQAAAELGLFNTHPYMLNSAEQKSIELARKSNLRSYNDYRELFDYPRVTDWNQISGRPEVCEALRTTYKSVDHIELFAGLFAEDVRSRSALSPLIGRMVGVDAFSQAFTNPLLSPNVFNPETFSELGWKTIHETNSLGDLLHRNLGGEDGQFKVTMTRDGTELPESDCLPARDLIRGQAPITRWSEGHVADPRSPASSHLAGDADRHEAERASFDPANLFKKK